MILTPATITPEMRGLVASMRLVAAGGLFAGMEGAKIDRLGVFTQWEGTLPDGNPGPTAFTGDQVVQPQSSLGQ